MTAQFSHPYPWYRRRPTRAEFILGLLKDYGPCVAEGKAETLIYAAWG